MQGRAGSAKPRRRTRLTHTGRQPRRRGPKLLREVTTRAAVRTRHARPLAGRSLARPPRSTGARRHVEAQGARHPRRGFHGEARQSPCSPPVPRLNRARSHCPGATRVLKCQGLDARWPRVCHRRAACRQSRGASTGSTVRGLTGKSGQDKKRRAAAALRAAPPCLAPRALPAPAKSPRARALI